jgi:hypothetical protein
MQSAGALLVGIVIGGIVRLTTEDLELFKFVRMLPGEFPLVSRTSPSSVQPNLMLSPT